MTHRLLGALSGEHLEIAKRLLGYPEGSVGRLMTLDFLSVSRDLTIAQVLEHIRRFGHDSETLNVIYVVDEAGFFIDDVRTRELLLAEPTTALETLLDRRPTVLRASDDQMTAIAAFKKYDRVALPVVDSEGVLVGIVTVDDILHMAEARSTAAIQKLGGQEALDLPYWSTTFGSMVRKRVGWLVVLFLGEMLTATAMGYFEKEIQRAVVLALFVPLIISSGGNSGSQASTLLTRALALGEVRFKDWLRVLRRELLTGLCLGAVLGFIGFLRISLWSTFSDLYGPHWPLIALTIWVALVGVVCWGALAGAMLPLVLKRMGADPATSSAPFVATLVDVTGLIIYFGVAAVILQGTLL